MELEAFSVSGMRCLADVKEIQLLKPTILTGANDGGKSSAINALAFLLGAWQPQDSDRTLARPSDAAVPGGVDGDRFAEIRVTGRFSVPAAEGEELGLPQTVFLRRCFRNGQPIYERLRKVCVNPALRDLEARSLEQLKTLAEAEQVPVDGHQGRKVSFLTALGDHATSLGEVEEWAGVESGIKALLPRLVTFANDDPEGAIRSALMDVYRETLSDDSIQSQLAKVEEEARSVLTGEADRLRSHLLDRCPELEDVRIDPQVSFRDQFPTVRIEAGRSSGELIGLNASGAGRRQRLALATWEFTQDLLKRAAESQPLVVCYDEPDNHLDYRHQRDLAELVRQQAALPGVRVILATHALNLIDKVPIENVVHLKQDDGRSQIEVLLDDGHQETDRFLANVAASMGLRTSVLLHERCFVGVEGVTEAQVLPILFRVSMGMPLQSAGVALIAASGNAGALQLARHLVSQGRPVRILVDEDTFTSTSTKRKFRSAALAAQGIDPSHVFRVGTQELEDLFSDAQWAATANAEWPREDGQSWAESDFAAQRKTPKFSDGVRALVKDRSPASAPEEKPAYLLALANRISSPGEVPTPLREIFVELITAAS